MIATIKPDFFLQEIAGERVLMGGGEQINFSKVLMLNRTSAFIIEELQRTGTASAEEMAGKVAGRFAVEEAEARADVEDFFYRLAQCHVVSLAESE